MEVSGGELGSASARCDDDAASACVRRSGGGRGVGRWRSWKTMRMESRGSARRSARRGTPWDDGVAMSGAAGKCPGPSRRVEVAAVVVVWVGKTNRPSATEGIRCGVKFKFKSILLGGAAIRSLAFQMDGFY